MLVVSTVEPLALGGEEAAVMVSKETNGNGREGMLPAMARVEEEEVGMERGAIRGHEGEEEEDEEVSMESPSKRIRLSSAEDEAGPCDSQDGVSQVCIGKICFLLKCMYLFVEKIKSMCTFQLSKPMVLEENGESSSGAVCAGPPSPGSETSSSEAMMDIDAECTSSEARLLTCAPTEAGPASTSTDASSLLGQNGVADSDKGASSFLWTQINCRTCTATFY